MRSRRRLLVLATCCGLWTVAPGLAAGAERGTDLQGSAFLGRNRPVVGATVAVRPEGDPTRIHLTSTNGKGAFRIGALADGSYGVVVTRDGMEPVVKTGIGLRFPFRGIVEVPMRPLERGAEPADAAQESETGGAALILTGRVEEVGGRPLADADLRLHRLDGREDPRFLRSGEAGEIRADGLSAGKWRLEIRAVGYLSIRTDVTLVADTSLTAILVAQPADYLPSPLDLMPAERPIPPPGIERGPRVF